MMEMVMLPLKDLLQQATARESYRIMILALLGDERSIDYVRGIVRIGMVSPPSAEAETLVQLQQMSELVLRHLGVEPMSRAEVESRMEEVASMGIDTVTDVVARMLAESPDVKPAPKPN